MSKFIDKSIEVISGKKPVPGSRATPQSFYWNHKWIHIRRVLELWKDTGTWWDGESEKTFFRVETAAGSLYELYQDDTNQTWFLYRIYD